MNAAEFDALCLDYATKQLDADEAKRTADQAKALVMTAVQEHGHVPTNAEASRRLEGADWSATVTTPKTIEIIDSNVTELELLLSEAKLPKVFPLLFSRRVEYSLQKDAERVLPQTSLPPSSPAGSPRSTHSASPRRPKLPHSRWRPSPPYEPGKRKPPKRPRRRAARSDRKSVATPLRRREVRRVLSA